MASLDGLPSPLLLGAALAILLPGLVGWGAAAAAWLVPDESDRPTLPDLLLLGILTLTTLGMLLQFALPLSAAVSLGSTGTGWALLWRFRSLVRQAGGSEPWKAIAPALFLALLLASAATLGPIDYDTGLYHLPTMVWLRQAPVRSEEHTSELHSH